MRQLKQIIKESSAPVAGATYVGSFNSQSNSYDVFSFRIGNQKVFVATINGEVARYGEMPWIWRSEREAAKQIAKWR